MDDGVTMLNTFAATGDPGDWAGDTVDCANSNAATGAVLPFTPADVDILDAMGLQAR